MIPIFKSREDNLKDYLVSEVEHFMFSEISEEFLVSAGLGFMKDVPIPIAPADLKDFTEKGMSTNKIADNIAIVIGSDTHFKYVDNYLQYLNKLFDDRLVMVFASKGEECLKIGNYRKGMAYLRAAVMFRNEALESMFCYANGCRYWYLSMEGEEGNEELITILKDEARVYYEFCSSAYPQFPQAWYFLGYSYLNRGEYLKTQIAWKHYMQCAGEDDPENVKEIEGRLAELVDPVKIEKGVNLLAAGRMEEGLRILEPYVNTQYGKWWPLHFNLACAYRELGYLQEAIEGFHEVLKLVPSNYDAMVALYELYSETGNAEMAEKYLNKSKLVKE